MYISSDQIKEWVLDAGYQKVGIAHAKEKPNEKLKLGQWLQKGNHGSMEWMKKREEERGNIKKYFPECYECRTYFRLHFYIFLIYKL